MRIARQLDAQIVRERMREYRSNPAKFFQRYGGGPSIGYDLIGDDGYRYPPAAIVQAALKLKDVKGGLKHSDSAGVALKAHGFRVVAKGKFRRPSGSDAFDPLLLDLEESERRTTSKVRVGADVLRKFVLKHRVVCEVTDVSEAGLLRVSHIVSWADDKTCRHDPENVILLSSLWDAAFDRGLVSFDDSGRAIFAKHLTKTTQEQLISSEMKALAMTESRARYLERHRRKYGFK